MSAKKQFLKDLKEEQSGLPWKEKRYLVGVAVMQKHRLYFSPMKTIN
jgi:hypothetical protein